MRQLKTNGLPWTWAKENVQPSAHTCVHSGHCPLSCKATSLCGIQPWRSGRTSIPGLNLRSFLSPKILFVDYIQSQTWKSRSRECTTKVKSFQKNIKWWHSPSSMQAQETILTWLNFQLPILPILYNMRFSAVVLAAFVGLAVASPVEVDKRVVSSCPSRIHTMRASTNDLGFVANQQLLHSLQNRWWSMLISVTCFESPLTRICIIDQRRMS